MSAHLTRLAIALVLPVVALGQGALAQDVQPLPREVRTLVAKAGRHLRYSEYGLARNALARADSLAPGHPEVMLPYAEVLYHLGQYAEALPRMKTAGLQLNLSPEQRLVLGRLFLMHNQPVDAKRWLTEALEHPESDAVTRAQAQLALAQLQHLADAHQSFTILVEHFDSTLNSRNAEFGACTVQGGGVVWFTAQRDSNLGGVSANGLPYEDVYAASLDPALGTFASPRNMGIPINSNLHDAVVGVAPDTSWLLLYRQTNNGDLSLARRRSDGSFGAPEPFPAPINTPGRESSAWLSQDGNTLIFNSERNGGKGGLDLYLAVKQGNNWVLQRGALDGLNTPYDEDSPYLHTSGTLYFASQGHNSMGGFDLFAASQQGEDLRWTNPQRLPSPANSPANDNFLSFYPGTQVGFFASDRPNGYGNWDIYGIEFLSASVEPADTTPVLADNQEPDEPIVPEPVSPLFYPPGNTPAQQNTQPAVATVAVIGVVREHGTNRPLEAQVVITDNTNAEIFARLTCNSQTGTFSAEVPVGRQVGLTVQAQGFSQFSDRFEIPEGNTQPMAREISLWPVVEGSRTILRNIYFLLDSDSLLPASRTELDYIAYVLQQNTELRMKVEGHCDATGPADYNLALSHKRAQSVVRYLVAKGIAAERLTALGLGETRLLSHENSEAAHAINRRVEFVVEGQPRR